MKNFEEFWPYYLQEHSNVLNRKLHFIGAFIVHLLLLSFDLTKNLKLLLYIPLMGYGFAWIGHFIIEKNRPATFKHPIWSLRGDFKMFYLMLRNKELK